jgi:hypothetical protein
MEFCKINNMKNSSHINDKKTEGNQQTEQKNDGETFEFKKLLSNLNDSSK